MCHLIAVVSKKRMIARPRICVYTGIFFLFKIVINLFRKFKRFIPLRKRIKVTTAVQFFKINFCLIDYIAKLSQHIPEYTHTENNVLDMIYGNSLIFTNLGKRIVCI